MITSSDSGDQQLQYCHLCSESQIFADLDQCHNCDQWVCPECSLEISTPEGDPVGVLCRACIASVKLVGHADDSEF